MSKPIYLFEDHCESYVHWREAGLKGLQVVHVDAHLDVAEDGMDNELLEAVKACGTAAELDKYRRNDDILWGGFHPGNYLYPAIMDGTVSKLIWVIPDWLPCGRSLYDWGREEVQLWFDMKLSDYGSFEMHENRLCGTLFGINFEICFLKDLKVDGGNIAWDIDTDYLIDEKDIPFIEPSELIEIMKEKAPNPVITTIAFSVNGGYLPPSKKYLGWMIKSSCEDNYKTEYSQFYENITKACKYADNGDYEKAESTLTGFENLEAEYRACAYLELSEINRLMGKQHKTDCMQEEVRRICPELIIPAYNRAMTHYRRKEYDKALDMLSALPQDNEVDFLLGNFISATIFIKQNKFSEAEPYWTKITGSVYFGNWSPSVKAHICYIAGSTFHKSGEYDKALDILNTSVSLNPGYARSYLVRGQTYLALGQPEKAAKDFRRFIRFRPDTVESMEARLFLAGSYRLLKNTGLEKAMVREIIKLDTTGLFEIRARLGKFYTC
ncbi:MAG: tetratricopeptide repeat protein [Firmicutes bacterium]|nr:tetratricopeptide repeat protein [Bacillota bacterium]